MGKQLSSLLARSLIKDVGAFSWLLDQGMFGFETAVIFLSPEPRLY